MNKLTSHQKHNFWLKIALCGLFVVVAVCFPGKPAKADFSQLIFNATSSTLFGSGPPDPSHPMGIEFLGSGLSGSVFEIQIKANISPSFTDTIFICGNVSSTIAYANQYGPGNGCQQHTESSDIFKFKRYIPATSTDGGATWDYTFDAFQVNYAGQGFKNASSTTFDPAKTYGLDTQIIGETNFRLKGSSSLKAPWAGFGIYIGTSSLAVPTTDANVKEVYFNILSNTSSTPISPVVFFSVPSAGSTSTDFQNFQAVYSGIATSSATSSAYIVFTANCLSGTCSQPGQIGSGSQQSFRHPDLPDTTTLPGGVYSIPKNFPLVPGLWQGIVCVEDNTGSCVTALASTTITFTITSPVNPGITPIGTSTTITTCDPTSGLISNSLCQAFVWLFYPSQSSLNQFATIKATYQNKPPFGYFPLIQTAISNLSNGTSSVVLITTSTESSFDVVFGTIKTGISWVLYFLLGWWIFHKFKNIDL
jgi:hypothetical protein